MYKEIVRALDYSDFAEIALLLFVICFTMMLYGVAKLSRNATERFASIPLSDDIQDPRNEL